MKGNSFSILLAVFVLSSCGKVLTESSKAPTTNGQVGIIASCTTKSQALAIAKSTGTMFRVINEKRNLMEFIGLTHSELKKLVPRAKLKANKIFEQKLIQGDFGAQSVQNAEYYGPHQANYRNSGSGRSFPHLSQIDSLGNTYLGEGVVIAVVDTGVYYNHPHLSPNIFTNSSESHGSNGNGRDDDGNGFRDDYAGWDFYNGDAFPIDDNGHGTHVAGLAASTYMGIAPKAKILPIKVLSASGSGDLGTITAGILYAIDRGADIINLSLGGATTTVITNEIRALINSVKVADANNTLIVAAAGNGGSDGVGDCNDDAPVYPANIQEANVLTVASVNRYNEMAEYSNFGAYTVHIAAPGGDRYTGSLYSPGIANCNGPCSQSNVPYVGMMGTSMATPVAAGMAAVMLSKNRNLSPAQIKDIMMRTSTAVSGLNGIVGSAGVINVQNALNSF
jgi:subtilisin family serine protease